jgi:hypothetical protein
MSVRSSAFWMTGRMRPVFRSSAHRLTDTWSDRSAVSSLPRSWTTASITWSVIGMIRPLSSASGMKRSGLTSEPSGRRQRTSASAPTHWPVFSSMIGW